MWLAASMPLGMRQGFHPIFRSFPIAYLTARFSFVSLLTSHTETPKGVSVWLATLSDAYRHPLLHGLLLIRYLSASPIAWFTPHPMPIGIPYCMVYCPSDIYRHSFFVWLFSSKSCGRHFSFRARHCFCNDNLCQIVSNMETFAYFCSMERQIFYYKRILLIYSSH